MVDIFHYISSNWKFTVKTDFKTKSTNKMDILLKESNVYGGWVEKLNQKQ